MHPVIYVSLINAIYIRLLRENKLSGVNYIYKLYMMILQILK